MDALESEDDSISEDSESEMTTVTQLTMSSTISNASAKLKKGISKRLGKAKTKTTKAFSKGLKGLKNSSEKLKSSLKRDKKKGSEKDEEPEISSDDKKSEEFAPEVFVDKTGDNDNGDEVEIKTKEAPETEPDSGVIVEDSQALETLTEELEKPVENPQPIVESAKVSKVEPESASESPKMVIVEAETVQDSKNETDVVLNEAVSELKLEEENKEIESEPVNESDEPKKILSIIFSPILEALEESKIPVAPESGSISEAEISQFPKNLEHNDENVIYLGLKNLI